MFITDSKTSHYTPDLCLRACVLYVHAYCTCMRIVRACVLYEHVYCTSMCIVRAYVCTYTYTSRGFKAGVHGVKEGLVSPSNFMSVPLICECSQRDTHMCGPVVTQ